MNPDATDPVYEVWLASRREDFRTTDLSLLVMRELRAECAPRGTRRGWAVPYLGVPSLLVGTARMALFFFLILIPT